MENDNSKVCSCCLEEKQLSDFSKTDRSGRLRAACKKCDYKREKIRKQIKKGNQMNESRFNAVFGGLSSIAKKVYSVVPDDTYWSIQRVMNELSINGGRHDVKVIAGTLSDLCRRGMLSESGGGLFTKEKIRAKDVKKEEININNQPIKENKMETVQKQNPISAIREISIKLIDIANDIDIRISEIEKESAEKEKETEKLKQLQALLKSLG